MRKGTLTAAVAAALLGLAAESAAAAPPTLGPSTNTIELRVVNKHPSPVLVYVQDAKGRPHYMGRVGVADFKVLQIPGEIAARGDLRIKIFPWEPSWSLMGEGEGVGTRALPLRLGDAVNVFVETNLVRTQVEIEKT